MDAELKERYYQVFRTTNALTKVEYTDVESIMDKIGLDDKTCDEFVKKVGQNSTRRRSNNSRNDCKAISFTLLCCNFKKMLKRQDLICRKKLKTCFNATCLRLS